MMHPWMVLDEDDLSLLSEEEDDQIMEEEEIDQRDDWSQSEI